MLLSPYAEVNDTSTRFVFTVFNSMSFNVTHLYIPSLLVCFLLSPTPLVYLETVAWRHMESNLASNQELRLVSVHVVWLCVFLFVCVSLYWH